MIYAQAVSFALAIGLMLSPEALILIGQGVGHAGMFFVLAISVATLLHVSTALSLALASLGGGEPRLMRQTLGAVPAASSMLCSRIAFSVLALPILLSTAGHTFNEVFAHSFPNFAFAYLLLAALAAAVLISQRLAEALQLAAVAVAITGLLALSIAGIASPDIAAIETGSPGLGEAAGAMASAALILVGYDLLFISGRRAPEDIRSAVTALILAGMFFVFWGLATFFHVPGSRLVETTVPYMIASRNIMGETGRMIMGAVVMAGTVAAVNVLLLAGPRMLREMSDAGLAPAVFNPTKPGASRRPFAGVLAIAGLGAGMMALGLAGEPETLVWLKGALLFWLLHYALVHLAVFLALRHRPMGGFTYNAGLGAAALFALFAGIIVADPDCLALVKAMLVLMAGMTVLSLIYRGITKRLSKGRGGFNK